MQQGFDGDDGPATEAHLSYPRRVAFSPDGNLYIADVGNERVRRVSPDGVIMTVAGGGSSDPPFDGIAAIDTRLTSLNSVHAGP